MRMQTECIRGATVVTMIALNSRIKLLIEILVVFALAEAGVMVVLPMIAPNASTLNGAFLDVGLVLCISLPLLYWRLSVNASFVNKSSTFDISAEKAKRSVLWIVVLTQLFGLLVTAAVLWGEIHSLDAAARANFNAGADRIQTELVRRLNLTLYGLKGARGALVSNPNFDFHAFQSYVQSRDMPSEFPGVRGVGLIERVERSDIKKFISDRRREGLTDFQLSSSGESSDLYVVRYIEPLENNRAALGFDLGSDTTRRYAVTYAIDTGQPTLLTGISLLQDATKSPGLLYLLPVYRNGTNPKNVEERRRDLLYVLYSPIVASELFGSVASVMDNTIDFEVFGGPEATSENLVFDADGILSIKSADEKATRRHFTTDRIFEAGSTMLSLRASSTKRFEATQDRSSLIIIGGGGTLISLLISVTVGLLASGRKRALDLATSMTAELNRMAMVVQHTANAVTIMDRNMRIQWVNRGFSQITGYSPEEALNKTPTELLTSGKSDEAAIAALIDGAQRGAPCRVELINRAKDGREYWADTEIQPMHDSTGAVVGFMEIGTDITVQKQIQRQLEAAVRDSRALLDTVEVHAIVSITDGAGIILDVNEGFIKISRYNRDELIGKNHNIVTSGVHTASFWRDFWGSISNGNPWRGEICNRAKDGSLYWVDSMIAPFVGTEGNIEKYISIRTDITARKQAERALSFSNALMEESQAVAKVGGWELNLLTGRLFWTPETYRLHDTTPEEFNPTVDAGVGYFLPESRNRISQALEKIISTGAGYDLELETLTTKGRLIEVRTTGSATMEDGRVVRISGIFQDITERKHYERSLQEARDRAEIATRSKAQFLANISHEIRTPMNAILGMLSLLQKTPLNHRQLDYAQKSEVAAKSLLGLINDILDFSKAEAGKMTLDPQPLSIEQLMRNLSVVLLGNLSFKPVQILFDVDAAVPAVVMADGLRLQQVLTNLGGNAVKFTERGEVLVSVRQLSCKGGEVSLEFSVSDTGIGIAPENQAHIFSGFSQAEASTTRKFGGTGLGLAISQRLVELMGGSLALQSSVGQGSIFSFGLTLPVVEDKPDRSFEIKSALVVDSNATARTVLANALRGMDWQVETAESSATALDAISRRMSSMAAPEAPFDVVFMDWHLTYMDGWQTSSHICKMQLQAGRAKPCIVMVAASRRDTLEQRSIEEQALVQGLVVKPVTPGMLHDAALQMNHGEESPTQTHEKLKGSRRLADMYLLVVEDNFLNQQIAEELLSAEGANVVLAGNGKLGVDAIAAAAEKRQFDAVLMDIQMPVMDGYEATSLVRGTLKLKDLPIIAMTANAMASDREECLASGMNAHIGKPFDLDVLVQTLLHATGRAAPLVLANHSAPALSLATATVPTLLDTASALKRMGGSVALYKRTAQDFLHALPAQVEAINESLSTETLGARKPTDLVHTLKGLSATLGAIALSNAAARMEAFLKSSATDEQLLLANSDLRHVAEQTHEALTSALLDFTNTQEGSAQKTTDSLTVKHLKKVSERDVKNAFETLTHLLSQDDLRALEQFAAMRESLQYFDSAVVNQLEQALQDLDLNAALDICKDFLAKDSSENSE